MRKHRKIGLGNIMGTANKGRKGYGIRQSRIERLGGSGGRKGKGAIRLGEVDKRGGSKYADDPARGMSQQRDVDLDSLVSEEPERYNDLQRTQGNVFMQEISMLKSWKN